MKNVMKDGLMGIKQVAQLDNADEVNEYLARGWSLITTWKEYGECQEYLLFTLGWAGEGEASEP